MRPNEIDGREVARSVTEEVMAGVRELAHENYALKDVIAKKL